MQPWIRVSGDVPTRVAAVRSALAHLAAEEGGGQPLARPPGPPGPPGTYLTPGTPRPSARILLQIVGGESTGKSTLAAALGKALPAVVVPEALRAWVEERGRVPEAAEQWDVMRAQVSAEDEALSAERPRWVVSDGGVLMTAVYSLVYYDDASLLPAAAELSGRYALTIWCDDDVPWQADPQRDGHELRAVAQRIIGEVLR